MLKNKFNKNRNDNKSSDSNMETGEKLHKPTRGLPRTEK